MGRRRTMWSTVLVALAVVSVTATAQARPNVLRDGGFERPVVAPSEPFETFIASLGPWAVAGSVDVVSDRISSTPTSSGWQPAGGQQSLDLNGAGTGAIWQDVQTTPGAQYIVRYSFAGNPLAGCGPRVKRLAVVWNGLVVRVNSFDVTGHSFTHMGWMTRRVRVTATGSTSRLAFESLTTTSFCGPTLDHIRLFAVS